MPYRYPPEFHRKVLGLLAAGRSVASLFADLGVSNQTIYNWRRQNAINREPGARLNVFGEGGTGAALRRIVELETELAVTKRAKELPKAQVVTPKKRYEAIQVMKDDGLPTPVVPGARACRVPSLQLWGLTVVGPGRSCPGCLCGSQGPSRSCLRVVLARL